MMVPKKSLFMTGAALLCMGAASSAQSGDGPVYRRVTEPLRPVSLDLQTGTLTRGPKVSEKALTTCSSFNNNDFSGFVGVDTGANFCEWWNTANKEGGTQAQRIGGKTGLMTGFSFAYCSSALDPASFGAGGSAIISFREGYLRGTSANSAGPTGTLIGAFALSGLPANTNCSSFFGGFNCYQITLTFGTAPICFGGDGAGGPEPNIAWSWQFSDLGTDGVLAKTFPFLSCVASCTDGPGSVGVPGFDGIGMIDQTDQYCPVGSILSTFQFGTTAFGGYFTSISMDVREAAVSTSSETSLVAAPNKQGKGPAAFTTVQGVGIGVTPTYDMDCSGATANKLAIWRVGLTQGNVTGSKYGTIYVPLTGFLGFNVITGNHGIGTSTLGPPFTTGGAPKDLTLACAGISIQGFCGDNPIGFVSNAIEVAIQLLPLK